MDSEILASERAHHRRFRRVYRVAVSVLLGAAALGVIAFGFNTSTRSGWVTLIGTAVIALGVTAVAMRMDRSRPGELASTVPWSFGQVYSGSQAEQIWNSMGEVLVKYRTNLNRLTGTTAMAERPGSFLYRKGHHLLDVRPSVDHPGWTVVSVMSAPDLPTTLTDFGRGHGINTELLMAVPDYRKPEALQDGTDA